MFKGKKKLLAALILSLFCVSVAAISTAAWFQLESNPATPSMITSDPHIEVNNANVKGYKSGTGTNSVGMQDYNQSIETISLGEGASDTTNEDQGTVDVNFDIPKEGYGYYLVKKNPAGEYTFNYNGVSYYDQLQEYLSNNDRGGAITQTVLDSKLVTAGEQYKVIHYNVSSGTRKTSFDPVTLDTVYPTGNDAVASISSNVITIRAGKGGTYKIWVDHNGDRKTVGFETPENPTFADRNKASRKGPPIKKTVDWNEVTDGNKRFTIFVTSDNLNVFDGNALLRHGPLSGSVDWGDFTSTELDTSLGVAAGSYTTTNQVRKLDYQVGNKDIYFATLSLGADFTTTYYNVIIQRHGGGNNYWNQGTYECGQAWTSTANTFEYWISGQGDKGGILSKGNYFKVALHTSSDGTSLDTTTCKLVSATNYLPDNPASITGYRFDGWYTDSACSEGHEFTRSTLTGDQNLYAKYTNIKAADASNYTVYLYDCDNVVVNDWNGQPMVYCWGDPANVYPNDNDYYPGDPRPSSAPATWYSSENNGHKVYKFLIPTLYPHFLFYKFGNKSGGNQSNDLDNNSTNDGRYYALYSSYYGVHRDGTWADMLDDNNTNRTIYLYDAAGTSSNPVWGDAPTVRASTESSCFPSARDYSVHATATHTVISPSNNGTNVVHNVYEFHISTNYDKIVFKNTAGNKSTSTLTYNSSKTYYVLTDGNTPSGSWYADIASTTASTYYLYDNAGTEWTAHKAYAWKSGDSDALYPIENNASNGVTMTSATSQEASSFGLSDASHLYKISVSSSYDKIRFNNNGNSGANISVDLTTTGKNGQVAILTTLSTNWNAVWSTGVVEIVYKSVYFIDGDPMDLAQQTVTNDVSPSAASFAPSKRDILYSDYPTDEYCDDDNSTYYTFNLEHNGASAYIYSNPDCAGGHRISDGANISSYVTDGVATLYVKYETSSANYKKIYVDVWDSHTDASTEARWSSGIIYCDSNGHELVTGTQVDTNLFKVTIPTTLDFKLKNAGGTQSLGHDFTQPISASSIPTTGTESPYLHIFRAGNGVGHTYAWGSYDTDRGQAIIEISSTGLEGSWTELGEMESGDTSINYFVYEHGIQIPAERYIRVVVSGSRSPISAQTMNYSAYSGNDHYITSQTIGGVALIKTTGYTGTTRFNFYVSNIDNNPKVIITMLPNLGDGYYIIPYARSTTSTYSGAVKMATMTDPKAFYTNFYASQGDQIFLKSYIKMRDTVYSTLAAGASDHVYTHATKNAVPNDVLEFKAAGNYDISINSSNQIEIVKTVSNGQFMLNPLDLTKKANSAAVWAQKTSLVIEVPFTCNNKYISNIALTVNNRLNDFVGVGLYCSASRLGNGNATAIYEAVRGSASPSTTYNALSSSSVITDSAGLDVPINRGDTPLYAYILVDYLPDNYDPDGDETPNVDYSSFSETTMMIKNVLFYLSSVQKL